MFRLSAFRGFTLLELVVTVGIVGVLATIAMPSWNHALHKARRSEARTGLLAIQHAQERFYLNHLRYSADLPGDTGLRLPEHGESGDYLFQLQTSSDGQQYRATATARAQGRQHGDRHCRVFVVDELGRREAHDANGQLSVIRCWQG